MIGFTIALPIKENNHSGNRLGRSVKPLSSVLKPLCAVDAARKFRDNPSINIAALVSAPAYETGTPFHTRIEAVPTSVRLSADIADLRQRNGYNLIAAVRDTIKDSRPKRIVFIFQQFGKVVLVVCELRQKIPLRSFFISGKHCYPHIKNHFKLRLYS